MQHLGFCLTRPILFIQPHPQILFLSNIFVLFGLICRPSQQLWSCQDGQLTTFFLKQLTSTPCPYFHL